MHIDKIGISKRNFYDKTGIANGTLDKDGGVSELVLRKYISTFEDVNPEWLLTGNGPMIRVEDAYNETKGSMVAETEAVYGRVCEQCRDKERIIDQQRETISALKQSLSVMQDRIKDLETASQKKK